MNKIIKLPLIMVGLALSIAACKGNKPDSAKIDSATVQDTIKHADTTVKVDTTKKATDTSDMKTDTVSKTIRNKTELKKTTVKTTKKQ